MPDLRSFFRRFADLALAGQEDQHVAGALARQLVRRVDDGVLHLHLALVFVTLLQRPVAHFHREGAAGDFDHRRAVEVAGEAVGVDGGGGDDDFQVRPARQQLLQVAQQEIDVQAALVRLVDDDGVVGFQITVGLRLRQHDAVRHQLDHRLFRQFICEAHLEADVLAQLRSQLLRDARRHRARGQPARLGVADQAEHAPAQLQADLGNLRGFAGAGLAADDHHLVLVDRALDVVQFLVDRQRVVEAGLRQMRPARVGAAARALHLAGDV